MTKFFDPILGFRCESANGQTDGQMLPMHYLPASTLRGGIMDRRTDWCYKVHYVPATYPNNFRQVKGRGRNFLCITKGGVVIQVWERWDPVRGGPRLPAPFKIWPFSPGSLNYLLDAPQNNFSCSLNLFWYLPAPSTLVNLLPELKSVLKCRFSVFLC